MTPSCSSCHAETLAANGIHTMQVSNNVITLLRKQKVLREEIPVYDYGRS